MVSKINGLRSESKNPASGPAESRQRGVWVSADTFFRTPDPPPLPSIMDIPHSMREKRQGNFDVDKDYYMRITLLRKKKDRLLEIGMSNGVCLPNRKRNRLQDVVRAAIDAYIEAHE